MDPAKYSSIRGEPLKRIFTQKPGDVRTIRERYTHFEADIPFTTRFMIDCNLTSGITVPSQTVDYKDVTPSKVTSPIRTCMVDIECNDSRGFPDSMRDEIFCITCHDSFNDDYICFLLCTEDTFKMNITSLEGRSVYKYTDEIQLLKDFTSYILSRDPDILSGWNFVDFDMPYIMGRMQHLGLDPSSLARIPGQTERNALRGRALFDLLTAYKKMHSGQKDSYRLDAIAMEELGEHKVRYVGRVYDLWKTQPNLLVEYNWKDVELCVKINKKDNIIEFYREIANYVGCPLDRTLNSSQVIDIYVLRKAHGKFVLPSKGFVTEDEFEGATVFEPLKGVRENIIVLDLKSLYPMSMMTINASMETKDPNGELHAPNGIRFKKSPDGITRGIISDLLKERDEKKALRNTYPFGSNEYLMYDMQQNVIKVIMNTYYGVSGYARFRLYDKEIGASVTAVGRAIIEHTKNIVEVEGYIVIYGDTDSVFIVLPNTMTREETITEARRLEKVVNASYKDFAYDQLNAETHYFSTKFEKIYTRFFQAGKKKRYAGLLTWKEGKEVHETDIVGFEMKRSDTPSIAKIAQKKIMNKILAGDGYESIRGFLSYVIKKYRKGKYSIDEIGIPGGFGKKFEDYDGDDAHLRGAKYSNIYLGTEFGKGSKPKRLYIRSVTSKYPRTDVICFEYADQVPQEFIIDYELMMEKTLKNPTSRIIEALGWNWEDIDPSRTTLDAWGIA